MKLIFEKFILGCVQGLTEFLPVSSSGHLVFFKHFFYESQLNVSQALHLHIATLLAVLFYFRREILKLIVNFFKKSGTEERNKVFFLFVASIPAGIVGIFFLARIDEFFSAPSVYLSLFFFLNFLILFLGDNQKEKKSKIDLKTTFFMGMGQAIAVLPGISRSGSTICAGLILGLKKEEAIVFSFLMSIPAILGGAIFTPSPSGITFADMVSFVSAFLTGVFSIHVLVGAVKRAKLKFFGIYTLVLAVLNLILL